MKTYFMRADVVRVALKVKKRRREISQRIAELAFHGKHADDAFVVVDVHGLTQGNANLVRETRLSRDELNFAFGSARKKLAGAAVIGGTASSGQTNSAVGSST